MYNRFYLYYTLGGGDIHLVEAIRNLANPPILSLYTYIIAYVNYYSIQCRLSLIGGLRNGSNS